MYTVSLKKFVDEFTLECLTPEISLEDKYISKSEVNRPALQLAGYFDYFDNDRIQIIGRVEIHLFRTIRA